jgi:hypothetical protein
MEKFCGDEFFLYLSGMNYQDIYNKLMLKARNQNRSKNDGEYYEAHHILPKCLGGTGKTSQWKTHPNIVLLTAKEHFIAHKLLVEIHPENNQLWDALACMVFRKSPEQKRYFKVSLREYVMLKEKFSQINRLRMKGVKLPPRSLEHSKKISDSKKGAKLNLSHEQRKRLSERMKGVNNPFYGKSHSQETIEKLRKLSSEQDPYIKKGQTFLDVFGEEKSKKIREKISKNHHDVSGENNPMFGLKFSEEHKRKISDKLRNSEKRKKTMASKEYRNKMSESLKKRPKLDCPHCGKLIGGGSANLQKHITAKHSN